MKAYVPDVVGALTQRLRRINDRKTELRRQYEEQVLELDTEIHTIRVSIEAINKAIAPILCPSCQGTGEESYTDAAGSRDTRPCERCHGTGIVVPKEGEK